MARDVYDRLIARAALGEFGDQCAPIIVSATADFGLFHRLRHAVFNLVTGLFGSYGLPNGNTYHSGGSHRSERTNLRMASEPADAFVSHSGYMLSRPSINPTWN